MQELQPGQHVAGYEVIRHVSSGGMASLYLAKRLGAAGFSKPVAIKIVHPHLAKETKFVQMFLDEARLAARIQHPNVVSTEELVEQGGTYMMVMEYVRGCSLFELIRKLAQSQRRLSVELAVWIGARIAEGLHAAHELRDDQRALLNVVHRDVSPQNVLISYAGHPKVIDFGIAKSRAQSQATRAGVLRGKIGYMSPEQANGLSLDRRTDVYALGVVLWECLTSRRLFRAKNEILQLDMVRAPKVRPPGEYADVPAAVSEVIMDALKPDPADRIATAQALRTRLLAACPAATTTSSEDLAGLLSSVMGDEIDDPIAIDLDEALDKGSKPAAQAERFVEQLTVAAPRARFDADGAVELSDEDILFDAEATAAPKYGAAIGAAPTFGDPSLAGAPLRFDDPSLVQAQEGVLLDPAFSTPPVDADLVPKLSFPDLPPPPPPKVEPAPDLLPRVGKGTASPRSLRFLTSAFSALIVIVALALAGFLIWRELPESWFEEAPSTPASQAERLIGSD